MSLYNASAMDQLESFRELINNTHNIVCIAGCYFSPAEVLQALEPVGFQLMLNEYIAKEAQL